MRPGRRILRSRKPTPAQPSPTFFMCRGLFRTALAGRPGRWNRVQVARPSLKPCQAKVERGAGWESTRAGRFPWLGIRRVSRAVCDMRRRSGGRARPARCRRPDRTSWGHRRIRSKSYAKDSSKSVRSQTDRVNFPKSPLIGSGRDPVPFNNQAFNARLKLASERARLPVISAHPLRHTAATLLLNEQPARRAGRPGKTGG